MPRYNLASFFSILCKTKKMFSLKLVLFEKTLSWEIVAMLAKVIVVGVRRIVAQGARDLTNYSIF
jgi:hypothetical protein